MGLFVGQSAIFSFRFPVRRMISDLEQLSKWCAIQCMPLSLTLLIGLGVSGCASSEVNSLPGYESVHVRSNPRPADQFRIVARRRLKTSQNMEDNVGKGAVAGGAGYGLACVALVPFGIGAACIAAAAGGAAVGAAAGAAVSTAVVDSLDQYPPESRQHIQKIIVEIENRRDFFVEIRDALRASIPEDRQVDEEAAEALVSVGPEGVFLVQDQDLDLAFEMTAVLSAEWSRDKRTPRKDKRKYTYTTSAQPIEYWLDNDGAALNEAVTECIANIVGMMSSDLEQTIK